MAQTPIRTEERFDVPPCQYCGGRTRWLNAHIVDLGPWRWHCAQCSPPPIGGGLGGGEAFSGEDEVSDFG
jgi:hypothetical protein